MDEQWKFDAAALPGAQALLPHIFWSASGAQEEASNVVIDALRTIRIHLDMEVAFVSEFAEGRRWFRYVDSSLVDVPIAVETSDPLEETFCQRVVDGRLPELIQDTAQIPATLALPVTAALPVGAYISVPIRLDNGRLYGTFCCFSTRPNHNLSDRDLVVMRMFADFTARQIGRELAANEAHQQSAQRLTSVLESEAFTIVYQPIVDLTDNSIVGLEALTRFWPRPFRRPDIWFAEALQTGYGEQLELAAIAKALLGIEAIPKDIYLSVNVAPQTILNGAIHRALAGVPLHRIMLEVTEHVAIPDYALFGERLAPLRNAGMRLAVDDAGAGYASFLHILQLNPDVIKLDIGLIRHIDTDGTRRALTAALVGFAQETGSQIVAEGVETAAELRALQELGVNIVQGYLMGYPLPLSETTALF